MSVCAGRRALLAVLSFVFVLPCASASASARHDRTEAGIVRAMNKIRAQHHLPRLKVSGGLARAADVHSASMARSGRLAHGDTGRRVRRYVRTKRVGENLAYMTGCRAGTIVRMWMNSSGHRQIMLSRGFRRVGVAKRNASRTCFVTADFASPR
jgi:uncharacterized protein YkwD